MIRRCAVVDLCRPSATWAARVLSQRSRRPATLLRDQFDLGYGYVQRKDYASAEQTFRDFLQRYPNDRMTPEVNYWLGEKPVPAPALSGRCRSLSRRDDEI